MGRATGSGNNEKDFMPVIAGLIAFGGSFLAIVILTMIAITHK